MSANTNDVLNMLATIPDTLSVSKIDVTNNELVVFCNIGENIDTAVARMFAWYCNQQSFKKVIIEDLNGADVEFRRLGLVQ